MEHYDICLSKRALAVRAGAFEVTQREAVLRKRPDLRRAATEGGETDG